MGAVGVAHFATERSPLLSHADECCWSYALLDGALCHDQRRWAYGGLSCAPGDTVHVRCDLTHNTVWFGVNHKQFEQAFVVPDLAKMFVYLCLSDHGDRWTCRFS